VIFLPSIDFIQQLREIFFQFKTLLLYGHAVSQISFASGWCGLCFVDNCSLQWHCDM